MVIIEINFIKYCSPNLSEYLEKCIKNFNFMKCLFKMNELLAKNNFYFIRRTNNCFQKVNNVLKVHSRPLILG